MSIVDPKLLEKVVKSIREPDASSRASSPLPLLAAAAGSFASRARPADDDATVPTGFDPRAAAMFEATVEAAFLVATADGAFDDAERDAFERVITEACGGTVGPSQLRALLGDLGDALAEDGLDRCVERVAEIVRRVEAQREVLRIASLLAHVSGGVSDVEQRTLAKLAGAFGLGDAGAAQALADVRALLG